MNKKINLLSWDNNQNRYPLTVPMKLDRHGRAKILTQSEIELLFNKGFTLNPPRDRALFAIMLYTAWGKTSEAAMKCKIG